MRLAAMLRKIFRGRAAAASRPCPRSRGLAAAVHAAKAKGFSTKVIEVPTGKDEPHLQAVHGRHDRNASAHSYMVWVGAWVCCMLLLGHADAPPMRLPRPTAVRSDEAGVAEPTPNHQVPRPKAPTSECPRRRL